MSTPEQQFATFRRTADGRALAAVFDAVAPELLLVAAHVAPAGAEAEDLVQATFLDAIEKADRWDATRPLVPWLIGILVNHARAERRRLVRPLDPERLADRVDPAPLDALAASDVAEHVAAALRRLPRHYRQAMTLRLVHGLSPSEIAHAIGCPVATVKTRLQRGMEWLRNALPASIAAVVAVTLTPGKGLAAVRTAVLAHAKTHVPAAATAVVVGAVGGGLFVNKLLSISVLLVGAAVWLVLGHPGLSFGAPVDDRPTTTIPTPVAAVPPRPSDVGDTPERTPTPEAGQRVAPTDAPADGRGGIELVAVWQADGTPAAGVRLIAQCVPTSAAAELPPSLRASTDAAGHLTWSDLTPGTWSISGLGFGRLATVTAGAIAELRVEVPGGVPVAGAVVDDAGLPVAGAEVWLQDFTDPEAGGPRRLMQSDAEGRFALRLDFGGSLWATKAGHVASRWVDVRDDASAAVQLVLGRAAGRLRGIVRGADGLARADAQVVLVREVHDDERLPPHNATTDGGGRFAVDDLADGAYLLVATAADHAATAVAVTIGDGAVETIDVALTRGATVSGAVQRTDGTPLAVECTARPAWVARHERLRLPGVRRASCAADGTYTLDNVPVGVVTIHVDCPSQLEVDAPEPRALTTTDGARLRCDFVVGTGFELGGRVVDAHGVPIADWVVLFVPNGGGAVREARTGPDGTFRVAGLDDVEHSVDARPDGARAGPAWTDTQRMRPGGGVLELRARCDDADGGRFHAALVGAGGADVTLASVLLGVVGDSEGRLTSIGVAPRDGRITLGPLPPARYRLRMGIDGIYVDAGEHDLDAGADIDLGTITAPARGTVRLRGVTADGQRHTFTAAVLLDALGNGGALDRRDADGAWLGEALPAGRYRLSAWGESLAPVTGEVVVVGDRTTDIDVPVVAAHPVQFAVHPPADTAGRWSATVVVDVFDATDRGIAQARLAIDTDGVFTTQRGLPPGTFRFRAQGWPGRFAAEGEFEVPAAGELPVVVDVRLVAPRRD